MASITLPGFPDAVSPIIETPDIAELLMYPNFQIAEADTVWRYGTDFQRKLLSLCPLKYNRKHVTVYSGVHIVSPHMRPITTYGKGSKNEWHIDGNENTELFDHWVPEETVFLFLSNASKPTEYMISPLEISDPKILNMNRREFVVYLQSLNNIEDFIGPSAPIENNRIYEFSNHIHTAVMPKGPEFRFTFRVRETDRLDIPPIEYQMPNSNKYFDVDLKQWSHTITQQEDGIYIKYPEHWLHY